MRWSESVTTEFVKIYLKHACLWDPQHRNYKLKISREKAYTEISTEFRASTSKVLSIPEVKVKIKNLRTTYIQQVHKILQKSSPDCIYEPSLVWFHEMDQYLKHVPIIRHGSSSATQQTPEVDSSSQILWVDQDPQNDTVGESNPDPLIPQDPEFESEQESNIKQERSPSPSYKKLRKKKLKRHSTRSPVYYMPDSNSDSKEDEFDIYGKYIASQLRQMNLQNALRLQLEIQNLVSKARISDM